MQKFRNKLHSHKHGHRRAAYAYRYATLRAGLDLVMIQHWDTLRIMEGFDAYVAAIAFHQIIYLCTACELVVVKPDN